MDERLVAIGYREAFHRAFAELDQADAEPARVARATRRFCEVWCAGGQRDARVPKKMFRAESGPPVVGDWVAVKNDRVVAVLERLSVFVRRAAGREGQVQVMAANIDVAFVMCGLDGDFNVRRIERYLALCRQGGVRPVIVLNKADAVTDPDAPAQEAAGVALEAPVHTISAKHDVGLDALAVYLEPGHTVALLGSSGVGKSTLVNRLLGEEKMRTAEVRDRDDRGRHTTTHRELIILSDGALLIDTPGMRELGMVDTADGVAETFADIEELAEQCRFADCTHNKEPDCAVQQAITSATLDPARLASYRKLVLEIDDAATRRAEREHLITAHRKHRRRKG